MGSRYHTVRATFRLLFITFNVATSTITSDTSSNSSIVKHTNQLRRQINQKTVGSQGYLPPSTVQQYKNELPPGSAPTTGTQVGDLGGGNNKRNNGTTKQQNAQQDKNAKVTFRKKLLKILAVIIAGFLLLVPIYFCIEGIRNRNESPWDEDDGLVYNPREMKALRRERRRQERANGGKSAALGRKIKKAIIRGGRGKRKGQAPPSSGQSRRPYSDRAPANPNNEPPPPSSSSRNGPPPQASQNGGGDNNRRLPPSQNNNRGGRGRGGPPRRGRGGGPGRSSSQGRARPGLAVPSSSSSSSRGGRGRGPNTRPIPPSRSHNQVIPPPPRPPYSNSQLAEIELT